MQWFVGRKIVLDNATMSNNNNGNNGYGFGGSSGSPSTAVAMIILYSITGVITALFLVIIITGAIRAHRHPERYGPRNVLGRPRQSRAKGLARAMLDTLPIVKFGEREGDQAVVKPTDVEMAPTAAAAEGDREESGTKTEAQKTAATEANQPDTSSGANRSPSPDITETTAVATSSASKDSHEGAAKEEGEAPSCSICTEDFERGQDVRVLPCNHSYHPACIDPWLLNVSGTCPLWYVKCFHPFLAHL